MNPTPKRRWFQFGLRTLFVVVTVFGIWMGCEMNWIRQRHALLAEFPKWAAFSSVDESAAPGMLRLFGEHGHAILEVRVIVDDWSQPLDATADVEKAERLFPEAQVFSRGIARLDFEKLSKQ
jgi:hypothetical protein